MIGLKNHFLLLLAFLLTAPTGYIAQEAPIQQSDSESTSVQGYLEEVKIQLNNAQNEEGKALLYSDIGFIYKMMGDFDIGLAYVDSGMALSEQLDYYEGKARAHEHLAAIYFDQGRFSQSLIHSKKELLLNLAHGDSLECGPMYYHIGISLQKSGKSDHALDTLYIAMTMFKDKENWPAIAECSFAMASIHYDLGNSEIALELTDEALALLDPQMQIRTRPLMLAGKSRILTEKGELMSAEEVLTEAFEYAEAFDLTAEREFVVRTRAELRMAQGRYTEALIDLNSVMGSQLYKESLSLQLDKSVAYHALGDDIKALEAAEVSLKYVESNESLRAEVALYEQLSTLYEKNGNLEKAHEFLKKNQDLEKVRLEKAALVQTRSLEARYRHEQQKVNILEKDKIITARERELESSSQQNRTMWLVLIGLLAISLITFIALGQRHKNKRHLAQIELDKALLESTEEERQRIAQELHDGTGSLLTGIKLSLDKLHLMLPESDDKEGLQYTISQVQEVSKEVRRVSHAMAPSTIDKMKFTDVLDDLVKTFSMIGSAEVHAGFSGDLELLDKPKRLMLYRILQECLNNSFKHAHASEINISISVENEEVELLYEDNGRGYASDQASSGIGLRSIEKRIDYLNGTQRIETSPGAGMSLFINFPLNLA